MKKNIIKVISICVIFVMIVLLARFAWAKYIAQRQGSVNADVAVFNFKVTGESEQESDEVVFAITRNDENDKVEDKMLAPGTSGEFKIGIDARRYTNFFRICNKH